MSNWLLLTHELNQRPLGIIERRFTLQYGEEIIKERNIVTSEYSPNHPKLIYIYQSQVDWSEFRDYRQSQERKNGVFNTLSMKI